MTSKNESRGLATDPENGECGCAVVVGSGVPLGGGKGPGVERSKESTRCIIRDLAAWFRSSKGGSSRARKAMSLGPEIANIQQRQTRATTAAVSVVDCEFVGNGSVVGSSDWLLSVSLGCRH